MQQERPQANLTLIRLFNRCAGGYPVGTFGRMSHCLRAIKSLPSDQISYRDGASCSLSIARNSFRFITHDIRDGATQSLLKEKG